MIIWELVINSDAIIVERNLDRRLKDNLIYLMKLNIQGVKQMVLFIIIAMIVIIIWLLSLSIADKIGNFFVNNVINKIKELFK